VSDFRARSFDAPRERPAPRVLEGRTVDGDERAYALERLTVVAVVKANCDGCWDFVWSDLADVGGVDVVVVAAVAEDGWRQAPREVLIAPALLEDLEVRGAPWYLLIDPTTSRVLTEGVLFSPTQVAEEVASFLAP
jgi:hypothetical protein